MDPHDWLDIADHLTGEDGEGNWRVSAGRAYYAAFHLGLQLLARCGFRAPDSEAVHGYVWLRIANCGLPTIAAAGNDLRELRNVRNAADYVLGRPFPHGRATHAVMMALNIAELFDEAAGDPTTLARLTDAVRLYERDVLRQVTWQGP